MTTDKTVIGSPAADGVKDDKKVESATAKSKPATIVKTTEAEGTGDNVANLGQPVADASGDQTDDPNAPSYIGDEEADKVQDRQNQTGVSGTPKDK